MYICFVKHPGCDKPFLFDCTDIRMKIEVGSKVVCQTMNGAQCGEVVSYPTEVRSSGDGEKAIIEATGAYFPLRKITRKFADVELLPEERREIAKRYIAEVNDLPF